MNGLVPALIAVLLAEIGPRALQLSTTTRPNLMAAIVAALIAAAAVGGTLVAPMLTEWADALMIGIALVLAAVAQVQRVKPAPGIVRQLWTFWSGGTALLAFAFAARFGAVTTGLGALGGLGAAMALSHVLPTAALRRIRLGAAAVLLLGGLAMAWGGLRLV